MRTANVVISILGLTGVVVAAAFAWRWRRMPLVDATRTAPEGGGPAALDGLRTLSVVTSAGIIAGVLVAGLGGRLLMRVLGATSGSRAQGLLTEADEVVGEITADGTIAIIFFVGLFGGLLAALVYLVGRRWLPVTAGPAGIVMGIILLGTIGAADAMSPDNVDFAILSPTWLATALIVVVALLFGVTFTALAARLDAAMPTLSARPSSVAAHASLVVLLLPPVAALSAIYIAGRAGLQGRLDPMLADPRVRRAGHVVVAGAVVVTALNSVRVIEQIIST